MIRRGIVLVVTISFVFKYVSLCDVKERLLRYKIKRNFRLFFVMLPEHMNIQTYTHTLRSLYDTLRERMHFIYCGRHIYLNILCVSHEFLSFSEYFIVYKKNIIIIRKNVSSCACLGNDSCVS